MENILPNQQQEPIRQMEQPEKKGLLKALAPRQTWLSLLEVGLIEVLLVGVVIVLLFGTLNYFNILPISELWTKQLGWLPQRGVPTGTLPHMPSEQSKQNPIPSPKDFTPQQAFQYDTKKAETLLTQYLKDSIKPKFLPVRIEVKQHLISDNTLTGTDYEFGVNWDIENIIFSANLHYLPNSANQITDMEFYINPPSSNIPIDATNSANLVKTYLKNIPETINFDCGTFNTTTRFCEDFRIKEKGKSGFGIAQSIDESGKNTILIFSCFIHKNDSYYNKRTSCLLFREKDPREL